MTCATRCYVLQLCNVSGCALHFASVDKISTSTAGRLFVLLEVCTRAMFLVSALHLRVLTMRRVETDYAWTNCARNEPRWGARNPGSLTPHSDSECCKVQSQDSARKSTSQRGATSLCPRLGSVTQVVAELEH